MGSSLSRIQIVQTAVKQAGRSAELNAHAKLLLNALLRSQALSKRYPCLRRIGSESTLSAGSATASVPSDIGAGTEVLIFGTEKNQLLETDLQDFVRAYGFIPSTQASARPTAFMFDRNAALFRFNASADQAYPFTPVYFRLPADLATDDTDDNTQLWYEDDNAIMQGLVWLIYQYTDDVREPTQFKLFDKMDADYRRGAMPLRGGSQRLQLSPGAFRPRDRR
jgi:hypothetical protein